MPFTICGVHEVPGFGSFPWDHIISIREAHQQGPDISQFKREFTLDSFCFADTGDSSNTMGPKEEQVQRLLDIYAKTTLQSLMLFHCYAGVSRSSAAAFIWLVYHGVPYSNAYEAIVQIRGPFIAPNQLMIKHADKLMGKNGEMEQFISSELGRRAEERAAWFEGHK